MGITFEEIEKIQEGYT